MRRIAWLALTLVATGCGGGGSGSSSNPRPEGSPDVVVLSVSGRCVGGLCFSPEENAPYLGEAGDAAEAIAASFQDAGYSVDWMDFISSLYSYDDDEDGAADRFGFLDLTEILTQINEAWIQGFDNPTRIVLVAHSHGCVWAHIATSVLPDVPVAYLISLDGDCFLWESDYPPDITTYFNTYGNPFSWDFRDPCDHWSIPGVPDLVDTEDAVWPNVETNLEVRSVGLVSDYQINYRGDGTRSGIFTHDSPVDNHTAVHSPLGESMPWVLDMLQQLGH
jgi:hypothetical protein